MASKALLLLAAAVAPSQAAIAAWWNGIGPQIILQNMTTGAIRHSACNAFGTPYYSYTDGSELPLTTKPKLGTPLAGTGYWDEKKTVASVYYLDNSNKVANALLECNMATGLFKLAGNIIVSGDVPVHPNTSLAALLLGEAGGYRAYFHDVNMTVQEIGYTQSGGWEQKGIISHEPQTWPALGVFYTGKENITVASARDERTVEVIRYNSDETWHITTLPRPLQGNITSQSNASSFAINETAPFNFTLTAWDGKPKSLGVSIDSEYTRSIWYIGTDKALYGVRNKNYFWSQQTNQSTAFWPLADEPGAEFGTASDFKTSMVRIYYFVKGQLAEIKYENGAWKAWTTVALPKAAVGDSPTSPQATISPTSSAAADAASGGLSSGAKAGIGVGVALGVIALGVLGFVFFLMRRKKNADAAAIPSETNTRFDGTPVPPYGSPPPQGDGTGYDQYMWEKKAADGHQYAPVYPAQLDAPIARPTELDALPRPMYELPDQTYSHELVGDADVQRHQAP